MEIFHNDWAELLNPELEKPYYRKLRQFLIGEYRTHHIYPDMYSIFNALHYTSYADTKVVILGQDPYHGPGQAHGLSFSVLPGVQPPPSLLNTVLTVREHQANSHHGQGWEIFTDRIIELLNAREKPMAFILWGTPARRKKAMITNPHHYIVESPHPSPLSASRGFFGSRPFSRVNDFLKRTGQEPIDWQLPDI